MKYIIGIGTNLGNRRENIEHAVQALDRVPKTSVLRVSKIYETAPVGYADQDAFYNACIELESALNPHEILGVCLGTEAGFGRVREFQNGPRVLDLDVLFAENEPIDSANLTLPHPRWHERRFVLVPLLELFPDGTVYGTPFKQHLLGIKGQAVKEIEK